MIVHPTGIPSRNSNSRNVFTVRHPNSANMLYYAAVSAVGRCRFGGSILFINVQFVFAVVKSIVGSFQARANHYQDRKAKAGEPFVATDNND